MTRPRTLTHLTLAAIFLLIAARTTLDADTFWHLATGRWMVENGRLLDSDVFSFTRYGADWHLPGWPVQIGMFWLYQVGGPFALNLAVAFIFTLSFWLLSKTLYLRDEAAALLIGLGAITASVHAIARPAMITFLFTALTLFVLERYRAGGKDQVWLLIPVAALWANAHPMFYLGTALTGVYLVGNLCSPDRRLVLYLVVQVAAMLLNPHGLAGVVYPITAMLAQQQAIGLIYEWQSPDFHDPLTWPFLLLFGVVVAAMGTSGRKVSLLDGILLAGFAFAALYSRRYIALFGLAGPLLAARYLEGWAVQQAVGKQPRPIVVALVGTVYGALFLFLAFQVYQGAQPEMNFRRMEASGAIPPRAAVEALRHTEGNLFNSYNYGGYLIWAMPERPVFVDSRAGDLYGDELLVENWQKAVMLEPGWQEVLERWDIQTVFIENTWPLAEGLKLAGWRVVYQDDQAIILTRPLRRGERMLLRGKACHLA